MATIVNIPNCGGLTGTFNSGIPVCDIIRSGLYGMIGLDAGVGFSDSETATNDTFLAALRTKVRNERGDRAYPMYVLTNFEDTTQDRTKAAVGNLSNSQVTTNDAVPAFDFQHRQGELFHKQLMGAQNAGLTWLLVDKNYAVFGTQRSGQFSGFSTSDFYVGLPKFGTASTLSVYPFSVVFKSITEFKELGQFIQSTAGIAQVTGLNDVSLSEFDFTGSVLKISATAAGGTNINQLYDTELTQSTAWVVKDSTGAAVTVTSAYDSTNKVHSLTLSGTPFTGATTGDAFTANLAAPAVLAASPINMDGYESTGAITVLKPA